MSLIAELKRRKVFKVGAAYLVVGWLVIEVASTILPQFNGPDWAPRLVTLLVALGLLIALVMAWVFDVTPEGIKVDVSRAGSKRMISVAAVLAALVLGWYSHGASKAPTSSSAADTRVATAPLTAAPSSALAAASDNSIAVLPFANTSGKPDEDYFSDGLSEDLITALAQFDQLKVIGRYSAFKFRDSKEDSKTIGSKLGVAHLLQGSVRHAGNTVRVNLELINASDGSALWSQHYDRPYKDLFKLQDEITAAVAGALKAKLIDGAQAAAQSDRPPNGRLDAYAAYLQGRFLVRRGTEADRREAIAQYNTAIRLDPDYALAHAELSRSLTTLASLYSSGADATALYAKSRAQADLALTLDPKLAVAHLARGYRLMSQEFDWRSAEFEFREAVRLAPNDRNASGQLGHVLTIQGRAKEGAQLFAAALENDPLDAGWHGTLASNLISLGRFDEAEHHLRRAIALQPGMVGLSGKLAVLEILRGNPQAALAAARQEPPGPFHEIAETQALQVAGPAAAADAALAQLIKQRADFAGYQIAEVYALRKDPDQTFAWLERARSNGDAGVLSMLTDPLLAPLKQDPRFAAFARKVGLPVPNDAPVATPTAMKSAS